MTSISSNQLDIIEIDSSDPRYRFVESLMHKAFPMEERRDPEDQRDVVDFDARMHCCVIENSQCPIGLLTYWTLDNLLYIEHFAIDEAVRGQGFGNAALDRFLTQLAQSDGVKQPVVLEVEETTDDTSRRRIAFYQRAGLTLWPDTAYRQPPYRKGGQSVPMRLMATPDLTPDNYISVRNKLYTHVYKAASMGQS